MTSQIVEIEWQRKGALFSDRHYSRAHLWRFDGGALVPGSSSPHVVRLPFSDPSAVDPEEAFVASLSSCHMLWFLDLAARDGFVIERYVDRAEGFLAERADGKKWLARVVLAPQVTFAGQQVPDDARVNGLHHRAHEECFLANSVRSEIAVMGGWSHRP